MVSNQNRFFCLAQIKIAFFVLRKIGSYFCLAQNRQLFPLKLNRQLFPLKLTQIPKTDANLKPCPLRPKFKTVPTQAGNEQCIIVGG